MADIIVIGGGAAAGDSYRLRPTRSGAYDIGTLISNERDIAAAEAVRSSATATNAGTGSIGGGAITTATGTTKLAALVPSTITLTYQAGNICLFSTGCYTTFRVELIQF